MIQLKGLGISPGIAIGRAFVMRQYIYDRTGILLQSAEEVLAEIEKFDNAIQESLGEIENVKKRGEDTIQQEILDILESHIEILLDPDIRTAVVTQIEEKKKNAADAALIVYGEYILQFNAMEDPYLQARAADLQDVQNRVMNRLNNKLIADENQFPEGTILITEHLEPSVLLTALSAGILGFASVDGNRNAHTSIIARSKRLPAIAGSDQQILTIQEHDLIILDGTGGIILASPDAETLGLYRQKQEEFLEHRKRLAALAGRETKTREGIRILLTGNISSEDEMEDVLGSGGDGAGLFRTEMFFLQQKNFPSEEEQFNFYLQVLLRARGKPVTLRTIDIGGDKPLPYFPMPAEQNPFLGYRGIRFSLDQREIFLMQLRAVLRASAFGNLKLMFPMISNLSELKETKVLMEVAKQQLRSSGTAYNEEIKTGIMVEVPSVAVTADMFAGEVDFFSIGTNDLCQYTLAADRMNEQLRSLNSYFHPSVLRLIKFVIDQARIHDIPVSVCGEMAADPLAVLLLTGMGLTEFSMQAPAIPELKNILLKSSFAGARLMWERVKMMDNAEEIISFLKEVNL